MIKIALYQYQIEWENKEANFDKLLKVCEKAHEQKVELLLLPEMSFSGFSMNTEHTAVEPEVIVSSVQEISKKYNLYIGFGWVKKSSLKCKNHYSIVGPNGLLSDYEKIHPFSYSKENDYFEGGNNISSFYLKGIPFTSFICYDLRFPEIFQLASKKTHVVIVPACWPKKRAEHWKCLLQARAIENQSYILAVNCVGNIGGLDYSGDSRVINPDGQIVAMSETGKEELLIYNLEDDVEEYREAFPVKKDRKEKLYEELRHECSR